MLSTFTLHCVSLSSVQVCRQRGSLLWNACRQEETYITEEEGGTAVDNTLHSLPVFLPLFIPTLYYLIIQFLLTLIPKNAFSSIYEDSLLCCPPDFWKATFRAKSSPAVAASGSLGSYTYCRYTQPDTQRSSPPASHHALLSFSI